MYVFLLFIIAFTVISAWAVTEGPQIHVNDIYPALAFFGAVVVAVLGWLLKNLIIRDRATIDENVVRAKKEMDERMEELKQQMNGLGLKLERVADTVEEKVSESVEELRRHDADLYDKFNEMNRDFGRLQGEHNAMKGYNRFPHTGGEGP